MSETFCFLNKANFDSKIVPGPVVEQRRKREPVRCFLTAFVISTVAEVRADAVGGGVGMIGDGGHAAMVEDEGGTWRTDVVLERAVGGGFALALELRISKIDDVVFFMTPS